MKGCREKSVQGAREEYQCCSIGDRGLTQIQYSASRPATRHTVITTDWGGGGEGEGGGKEEEGKEGEKGCSDRGVSNRRTACKTMHSASAISISTSD